MRLTIRIINGQLPDYICQRNEMMKKLINKLMEEDRIKEK